MNSTPSRVYSEIGYGSPLFEILSRFVGGATLGFFGAALAMGAGRVPLRVQHAWPQHPLVDALGMGFLIAVCLSPFIILIARHRIALLERRAGGEGSSLTLEAQEIWSRVGRRSALAAFAVGLAWLYLKGFEGVELKPLSYWG